MISCQQPTHRYSNLVSGASGLRDPSADLQSDPSEPRLTRPPDPLAARLAAVSGGRMAALVVRGGLWRSVGGTWQPSGGPSQPVGARGGLLAACGGLPGALAALAASCSPVNLA
eukprot:gene13443-biopygen1859